MTEIHPCTIGVCPVTHKTIFREVNGKTEYIESHGQCEDCGKWFHIDALKTPSFLSSDWPVRYRGFTCRNCWPNISIKEN